jgi:hypothetical protein
MRLIAYTSVNGYTLPIAVRQYVAFGNVNGSASNWQTTIGTFLPVAEKNTNTGLAADHTPMFTSPSLTPYMAALPSDFAVTAYYASFGMAVQDTFVVDSGSEEWEMIVVAGNATASTGKMLFCARTV